MKYKFSFGLLVACGAIFLLAHNGVVSAQTLGEQINAQINAGASKADFGEAVDPRLAAAGIIKFLLSLLGTVFFIFTVFAGYLLVTAHGDEEKITKAKATLRSSMIGLAIILSAYGITALVTGGIQDAVGPEEPRRRSWIQRYIYDASVTE